MYLAFKYISFVIVFTFCLLAFYINKHPLKDNNAKFISSYLKIYNKCIDLLDKYWLIALIGIFAVFIFTRFYRLDVVPAGVHVDEVGYWYDAKNLVKYGTDRAGNRYPWFPIAYGDGQCPLYCYMCVVLLHFFPFSIKLMRMVMAISAIPFFFATFGIVYQLYENRRFALIGPILVTITPYVFSANRWGLNAYQALYVCGISLYFLIKAIKYGRTRDYFFSGIFVGLSLVAYTLSYIMMPVFFVFVFAYLIRIKHFKLQNMIAMFIPCVLIGMPFVLEQLVNLGLIEPFYFLGSDYFKLSAYRIGELSLSNIFKNLLNIIPLIFGDPLYTYNSLKEFGTIYWASIPLLITGLIIGFKDLFTSIKARQLSLFVPIMLYVVSVYFGFLFDSGCNTYKANAIYIAFILLIIVGLRYISGHSAVDCLYNDSKYPEKSSYEDEGNTSVSAFIKKSLVTATLAVLAVSFLAYTNFYFRHMNSKYGFLSLFISTIPGDMIKYEESMYNLNGDKKVYMELNYENRDYADWVIALYTDMDPDVFTKYEESRQNTPEDKRNSLVMDHYIFSFPEDFDEDEDAIYILGYNWDHISGYLTSVGFICDESFPGYKILYR